jgi:hypothetical protein
MPTSHLKRRSIKALLGAVILALVLAVAFALSPARQTTAEAMPCYMVEHYYYSDATYTTQVGYKFVTCNGIYTWGQVTVYKQSFQGDCCGSCCDR